MNERTLFMQTTKIEAGKTIAEITALLVAHGAQGVIIEYEQQEVLAMSFRVIIRGVPLSFRMPCRWQPVEILFKKRGVHQRDQEERARQAKRTAWRQVLRWAQAQPAMVEVGMVEIEEVFLPYLQDNRGKTLYGVLRDRDFAGFLPAPAGPEKK